MDNVHKIVSLLCIFHMVIAEKVSFRTEDENYDYSDDNYENVNKKPQKLDPSGVVSFDEDQYQEQSQDQSQDQSSQEPDYGDQQQTDDQDLIPSCWMTLSSSNFFKAMEEMEQEFAGVRESYQLRAGPAMDQEMLVGLLRSRGAAQRAVYKVGGDSLQIPAGINLGGFCMVRLTDSILFFHRMKLRNRTHFEVKELRHDLVNMVLSVKLGLNDLHLAGAYERSPTREDGPSTLYYRPSLGNIELLLKNVDYHMEGNLRMMADRITLELICSELVIKDDILLTYLNTNLTDIPEYTVSIEARNMDDYFQRLKTDLDLWLKDYFNDYLMFYQLPAIDNTRFQEAEKKKTIFLNEYVNYAINAIRQRVYDLEGDEILLPTFTLFGVPSTILRISEGRLRGLETMHSRSVATGVKAEYKFEAVVPNGDPPLTGHLILTGDEMATLLTISLLKKSSTVDLNFDFLHQLRAEFLTIEGPANRLIANYKHMIENQILAIISNALVHNIKMLRTITRCSPFLYGNPGIPL